MSFFRPVIAKALLSGGTIKEVNERAAVVANGCWEYINDSDDGTLHVAKVVEIPEAPEETLDHHLVNQEAAPEVLVELEAREVQEAPVE